MNIRGFCYKRRLITTGRETMSNRIEPLASSERKLKQQKEDEMDTGMKRATDETAQEKAKPVEATPLKSRFKISLQGILKPRSPDRNGHEDMSEEHSRKLEFSVADKEEEPERVKSPEVTPSPSKSSPGKAEIMPKRKAGLFGLIKQNLGHLQEAEDQPEIRDDFLKWAAADPDRRRSSRGSYCRATRRSSRRSG